MIPPELVAALREGRVVASVGAGFSASVGLPCWEELLREIVDECGLSGAISIPSEFSSTPYSQLDALQSEIISKAGRESACRAMKRLLTAQDSPALTARLDALFSLPLAGLITWNWDSVLDARCGSISDGFGVADEVFGSTPPSLTPPLVKLQGSLDDSAHMVLEGTDYARVAPTRDAFLRRLYLESDRVVLHLGQALGGLSGGVVGSVLVEGCLPAVRHFALVCDDSVSPEKGGAMKSRGVGVLWYAREGLCGILSEIAAAAAATSIGACAAGAYTIRAAELEDAAAIGALWHSAYFDQFPTQADIDAVAPEFIAERRGRALFDSRSRAAISATLVAASTTDSTLGGFVVARPCAKKGHGGEIEQLFVARGGRGGGLGTALLRAAEARLAPGPIWLYCIPANAPARRFYGLSGFVFACEVMHGLPISGGRSFDLRLVRFEKTEKSTKQHFTQPPSVHGPVLLFVWVKQKFLFCFLANRLWLY